MRTTKTLRFAVCCMMGAWICASQPVHARRSVQAGGATGTYTGNAVDLGMGVNIGTSTMCGNLNPDKIAFTLQITGTTPDQDLQRYTKVLKEQGQDALLKAMATANLGSLSFADQTRVVNFARETPLDTGRLITVMFARVLDSPVAMCGADPKDYLFGFIQFSIGNDGKKNGSLFANASIRFDESQGNAAEVANYGTYPARVMNLEIRRAGG